MNKTALAVLVFGVLAIIAGVAAFVLLYSDQVNYSEEDTARKVGMICLALGALISYAGVRNLRTV